jgi:hypothetical protein
VSRNHLAGRNHSDVRGLSFQNQGIRELPTNVEQFFPNIESIDVTTTLEELSREDLSAFPRLRELHLNNNRVQVINSNLFAGNPEMVSISFISNPVRNVASGVFDHLVNLTQLRFDGVACHNGAGTTRATVLTLLPRIATMCPPTFDMNFEMIEDRLLNGSKFQTKVDAQVSERINPLTFSVFQINQRLTQVEEEIKKLQREISNLTMIKDFLKENQGKMIRI